MEKKVESRQIDKKSSKQVRIDSELHRLAKIRAAESGTTIKTVVEQGLAEVLSVNSE